MLTEALVIAFFVIGIQLMVPILWAALGETLIEQSGVLNVGIEGVMLIGALVTALIGIEVGNLWLAVLGAIGAGVACGITLSVLYVFLGTDQIVTGLLFNIFALGLTGVLHSLYIGGQIGPTFDELEIWGIKSIPWVGEVLSSQNVMFYLAPGAAFLVYWLLHRTWWGLYVRAAGERPLATESGGLNVHRLRYPALILGSVMTSLGDQVGH